MFIIMMLAEAVRQNGGELVIDTDSLGALNPDKFNIKSLGADTIKLTYNSEEEIN